MIMKKIILSVIFVIANLAAQNLSGRDRQTDLNSMYDFDQMSSLPMSTMPTGQGALTASIDEEKYLVDAGDVFLIKIDVEGPAFSIYNPMVTPDGYLFLPNAPSIYVRHQLLKDVKEKINKSLRKVYSRAIIESYLFQIHPIRVSVIGNLPSMQKLILFSSNRLADAVNQTVFLDSVINVNPKLVSFRNIKIHRQGVIHQYDLLEYKFLGDFSQNPYLTDNDIIEIQLKDTTSKIISVEQSIISPGKFEYKQGDNLKKALAFSGGLKASADSNRIELIRFSADRSDFTRITLEFPGDSTFLLKPDDRILVRRKAQFHLNYLVAIEGEVLFPGAYNIMAGKTTLSEIVEKAGGFTERSSLDNAVLLRSFEVYENKEKDRISSKSPMNVSQLEYINFKLKNRENRFLVNIDFRKLFIDHDQNEDVFLYNDDLIVIPELTKIVFISGGVKSPGSAVFHPGWHYEQYIESVGGYSHLARKGRIKIVKSKTGKWLDADNEPVEEGDIIYIPEREERDWWRLSREGLLVIAQIGGIALVIITLFNANK
jgi:protein involved in polysaccharide export with SLBB domain